MLFKDRIEVHISNYEVKPFIFLYYLLMRDVEGKLTEFFSDIGLQ